MGLANLDAYLNAMLEVEASDLFLNSGTVPTFRVQGELVQSGLSVPSDGEMRSYIERILTPVAMERFDKSPDLDIAHTIENVGRFRINVYLTQGRIALAARSIPLGAIPFDRLNLPTSVLEMAEQKAGLILVVGPTGCGKSTTLAALIHHINFTRSEHIVTIEDPIEFVHDDIRSLIHQRQVGYDTKSFSTALRHVVRQNPDVILIGEMRDRDTVETAINAALTGHLILSTLHTTNVPQSIDRMLSYFPPEARGQAIADMATTLVGIVAMRLLPRKNGKGRIPAVEVLKATPTVRRALGDGEFTELYDVMKRSEDDGMQTMNQSLLSLVNDGWIRKDVALRASHNADELRLNMDGMFTGIDSIDLRTEKNDEEE